MTGAGIEFARAVEGGARAGGARRKIYAYALPIETSKRDEVTEYEITSVRVWQGDS